MTDDLLKTYYSGLYTWRGTAAELVIKRKIRRLLLSKAKRLAEAMAAGRVNEARRHVSELMRHGIRAI